MSYNILFYVNLTKNVFIYAVYPYPDAIGAQLQHVQAREVFQVGNAANFVVKQKKFLHPSQPLQTLHLPQNVEGHVKLPVISQTNMVIRMNCICDVDSLSAT